MTTKLNLVNDQIVALSVTTTESLVANTISGDGTRVSNVDAVLLDGQNSAYYRNYNNLTNTPDLTVYTTKSDSVASNNAIKGLIDTKMAVSNVVSIQTTLQNGINDRMQVANVNSLVTSTQGTLQASIDTKLAVSNAIATFAPINNATMTGTTEFANLSDGTITITGFVDEDNMSSDSASLVPTQQSVKAYVDTEIGAITSDFTLSADNGTDDTFTTGGTLTFAGTTNEIETTVTNDQIQIGLPDDVTIGNNLTVTGALNSDDITAAQVTVGGNAVITGNLTVQGTTTTVNSTTVEIADSVFRVNSDGSVVSAGIEAIIGANTESILFNPTTQRWEFSDDIHTAGNLSVADVTFANLNDGTTTIAGFVDEDNMASDSATLIPTQQSVKAYVDTELTGANATLQADIDDRMQVANVNTLVTSTQTTLQNNIDKMLAVSNAAAIYAPINNATLTGTTEFANLSDGTITVTAFVDEDNMASDSATLVPTQQSVKAYVDTEISGANASLQADIDDRMQVANVNTIKTNLENSIDTKLAVANASLQTITDIGSTTTATITTGGLTTSGDVTAGNVVVNDTLTMASGTGGTISGAGSISANTLTATQNLAVSSYTVSGIIDDDSMASASNTTLATSESVKAYVDTQITAQDVDFAGDSGTGAVDLDSQSLTIAGGTGLTSSASGQTLTVALDNTAVAAGTYGSSSVVPAITVDAQGRITNVSNNSITTSFNVAADSGTTDTVNGGETLTFAGTANEIETTVTNNQLQIGLPNNVTIGNNLTVSGALNSDDITAAQVTVDGNAVITGNLTVQGTTTTVDSTTVQIADSVFRVNSDGSVVSAGLEAIIGANTESILFNPTTQRWEFSDDVYTATNITTGGALYADTIRESSTNAGITFGHEVLGGQATFSGQVQFGTLSDGTISGVTFVDEDNMASDSATKVPTQQSVKAYVDTEISGANASLQADIDDRMQVANVNTLVTSTQNTLQNNIDKMLAVSNAAAIYAPINNATLTGTTEFANLSDGTITVTAFVDEDNMASDSASLVPTQQSVKAYVDTEISGANASLQADIDDRMQVANVNTIKTNLENSIDTKMAVANVNTIKTNLENSIDTKLAVANASLQTITDIGSTTTATITAGGFTTSGDVTASNVVVNDSLTLNTGTGGSISGASNITANTLTASQNLAVGGYTVSGINDDDTMANASNTTLATSESVKAYVDSQVTAQDVDFAGDSGTGAVDLDSQSLTIAGGTGLTSTASGQTLTVALDDTAVSIGTYGSSTVVPSITVDQQGRITNISNNSITTSFNVAADSGTTDTVNGGETLTFAGTTNEIETTVTNNQLQIGLPNNVTIGNNLTVTGALNSDDITAAQVSVNGNAVITGNLTVQGTTTTVNSTEVTIADSVFRVNSDGSVVSAGLEAIIGANTESILFNPSTQRWEFSGDIHTAGNLSVADVTFANLNDGTITIGGFVDEDNMSSDSATLVPTQQSVKAYVDTELTGANATLQADIDDRMQVANVNSIQTTLQANIDTKMAVANVTAIQTSLQTSIDDRMQVANVNTIKTNLENSIDTKLAVANATLQTITTTGATTNNSITVGGLTAASIVYPGSDGTAGQALVTDGSGNLSFDTVARDPVPTLGTFNSTKLKAITPNGNTAYALQYANGASYSVNDQNSLLVSLNGVIQEPGSSFTTGGTGNSTITFSTALNAQDQLNFIIDMAPTGTFTITNETVAVKNINANTVTIDGTNVNTTINTKLATADFNSTLDARLSSGSISANVITTGNMTAANFNTTSDQRLKSNIADAAPSSAIVDAIQVRQYDWNDSGKHDDYGFVAQELHAVYPAAVTPGNTEAEIWTVDFSKLVPLLVKEVQDLKARIAELEG